MKKQQGILIFGMHRSGTSAFAGVLQELGIPMGKLMDASYDNPKGFFENKEAVAFNDRILNVFGQTWDALGALPENWQDIPAVLAIKAEIKTFILRAFKDMEVFAIKDPRFSLTLSIWKQVFSELAIELKLCILVRHPYEVAHSLAKRNYFSKEKSIALWLKYQLNAELLSREEKRYFIKYADFLKNPAQVLKALDFLPNISIDKIKQTAATFIDTRLRHHQANQAIDSLLVKSVYELLEKSTKEPQKPQLAVAYDKVRAAEDYRLINRREPIIATLAMDYGNGFGEIPPIRKEVNLIEEELTFSLQIKPNSTPKVLHFYPTNKLATIQLKSIKLLDAKQNEITIKRLTKSPLLEYGTQLIFDQESFFDIRLAANSSPIAAVVVQIKYLALNKQALEGIRRIGDQMHLDKTKDNRATEWASDKEMQKSSFWLNFVKTGMKYPFRFLGQINSENIRILRRALANESPAMILKNLKKLLQKEEEQPFLNKPHGQQIASLKKNEHLSQKNIAVDLMTTNDKATQFKKLGKLLYVFQDLPDYDQSSGGKRALRILELLSEDFEVYVFSLGKKPAEYVETLKRRRINVLQLSNYKKIKAKIADFRAIIYSFYRTYHESKQFVKLYPKAKIIIDTIDLNWLREERSVGVWEGLTKERVAKNKLNEIKAYQEAAIIWAVTDQDKKHILKEIPDANVQVVSNVHDPIITHYTDNKTSNILFIGNYHHYPNISAVKQLALEIFPKVKAVVEEAQLVIAGSNAPDEIAQLANKEGIVFEGYIAEEAMNQLYEDAFVSVSPLLIGAGIKGKICESIAYMTPVVTNEIGNEGINLIHEEDGLICELEHMSKVLVKALNREYDFAEMTRNAQSKLFQLVGSQVVKKRMLLSIFPEVTICIVTWNRLALLKKCLDSIAKYTVYPNYKVLVYSNACTDGTPAYLTEISKTNTRIIPILAAENSVFVRPNNQMMMHFPDNDVVLLNNDVCVTDNWLMALHNAAYSSVDYGIVGSKLLYPNGTLQEFGSEIYADGSGFNRGKGAHPNQKRYIKEIETGYVSGCSMYIKRSTIDKIGVFDDQFHPCYFEDSDYCYTAKEHGLKTIVTPNSIVYHEEGGTAGTDTNTGFKKFQAINKEKFLAKHKAKLRK